MFVWIFLYMGDRALRLPRDGVEFGLERFKTHLETLLCNLLKVKLQGRLD